MAEVRIMTASTSSIRVYASSVPCFQQKFGAPGMALHQTRTSAWQRLERIAATSTADPIVHPWSGEVMIDGLSVASKGSRSRTPLARH